MNREEILELSNELLARYKKKAGAASSAADREGNTELANKRFRGVMKASKKQFANDAKARLQKEESELQTEETKTMNTVDFYAKYLGSNLDFRDAKRIQEELNESKSTQIEDASEVNEEDLEEAFPGTPEYKAKYGDKGTGKFDVKKTATGTVYTKKMKDDDEDEKPAAKTAEAPAQTGPKKRGRPAGWRGSYKPRQPKTVKEAFEAIARLDEEDLEAFIDALQLVEDQE